jgi:hypothetical protein
MWISLRATTSLAVEPKKIEPKIGALRKVTALAHFRFAAASSFSQISSLTNCGV